MKPYAFLPLPDKIQYEKLRKRNKLNENLNHGKWIIQAKAITPLIIATGSLSMQDEKLIHGITTVRDVPILPGSSLKGLSRSIFEAISYSCIAKPRINKKILREDEVERYMPQAITSCDGRGNPKDKHDMEICPACQVYGYVSLGGRGRETKVARSLVSFSDFTLQGDREKFIETEKVPSLYQPLKNKAALKGYLDDEEQFQRKFYTHGQPQTHDGANYQVIKVGSIFKGELTYENLTDEDIGRLAFSLGISENPFISKIGYGKPAYFGSIQFEILQINPYRTFGFESKSLSMEDIYQFGENLNQDDFTKNQKNKLQKLFNYETQKNNKWLEKNGVKGY